MKQVKLILLTLAVALPAFLTGRLIWPPAPGMSPTPAQIPFFIILSIIEALSLGIGVAFVVSTWPLLKKLAQKDRQRFLVMFVAIAWVILNWWVHDNLHAHNGMDLGGLLFIEYTFHVTLILAGVVLAYQFTSLLKEKIGPK